MGKNFQGREPEDEYEVGYKKPPQEHQFKPGHGKSKGRRKGSKNIRTLFTDEVLRVITFEEKGRTRRAPALQLMFRRQTAKGLQGDPKATSLLVGLSMQLIPPPPLDESEPPPLSDVEYQIYSDVLKTNKFFAGEDDDDPAA